MENKLSCKQFMRRAVQKLDREWGRVPGWPLKRKRGANKLNALDATALGLSRKDTAAGLVRSACLGSYHAR